MSLVVKHFYANSEPNSDGNYVEIFARQAGVISWLLTLFRIDPTYKLKISYDNFLYESSTFTGFKRTSIPAGSICSFDYGIHKPYVNAIIFFLFFCLTGYIFYDQFSYSDKLFVASVIALAGFCVAVLYYIFSRQPFINISDLNGNNFPLVVKRSFFEMQTITQQDLGLVANIISAILRNNRNLVNLNNPDKSNLLNIAPNVDSSKSETFKTLFSLFWFFLALFLIYSIIEGLSRQPDLSLFLNSQNTPEISRESSATPPDCKKVCFPVWTDSANFKAYKYDYKSQKWLPRPDGTIARNGTTSGWDSKKYEQVFVVVEDGKWRQIKEGEIIRYQYRENKFVNIYLKQGRWYYETTRINNLGLPF